MAGEADSSRSLESLGELARRGYATIATRGIEAWIDEFAAPDYIWDVEPMALTRSEGSAAFREFYADWTVAYAEWFIEPLSRWRAGRVLETMNFPTFEDACAAAEARTASPEAG